MIIVVMGVAGSGKTRIGQLLAERLQVPFLEGDEFHPPGNIAKMAAGIALDDADRIPWLDAIHERLTTLRDAVVSCSALKEAYRQRLRAGLDVRFVFLRASRGLIAERLRERAGHFFAPGLIDSQFDALEEPEDAINVDASLAPEVVVDEILRRLRGSE